MSNTKRSWPDSIGKPSNFENGFEDRIERGHVRLRLKNEGYWSQKAKAFAKAIRTRASRRKDKVVKDFEYE